MSCPKPRIVFTVQCFALPREKPCLAHSPSRNTKTSVKAWTTPKHLEYSR